MLKEILYYVLSFLLGMSVAYALLLLWLRWQLKKLSRK